MARSLGLYLVMAESYPRSELLRYGQNIPQYIYLELIKILVDRRLQ